MILEIALVRYSEFTPKSLNISLPVAGADRRIVIIAIMILITSIVVVVVVVVIMIIT